MKKRLLYDLICWPQAASARSSSWLAGCGPAEDGRACADIEAQTCRAEGSSLLRSPLGERVLWPTKKKKTLPQQDRTEA
jgi:hypothetical protein